MSNIVNKEENNKNQYINDLYKKIDDVVERINDISDQYLNHRYWYNFRGTIMMLFITGLLIFTSLNRRNINLLSDYLDFEDDNDGSYQSNNYLNHTVTNPNNMITSSSCFEIIEFAS